MTKKILIIGGHFSPALAVIEELEKRNRWEIFFVGRKYPLEGDKVLSLEYRIIKKRQLPFFDLKTGRFQRKFTRYTIFSLFKIPLGLIQSFLVIKKTSPDIILSFGGYIAFPVVIVGWLLRIPIITHEQTMTSGLANKIIAFFAKKICLSWPETVKNFPKEKIVLTGNPVRREIFNNQLSEGKLPLTKNLRFFTSEVARRDSSDGGSFKKCKSFPLIYITGGSLGAHSINEVVLDILPRLLEKYRVIHQCGDSKVYRDYKLLEARGSRLETRLRKRYYLTKFVELEDIGWVLNNADLVISRAGANTMTELLALGKPAILIPLPWAGAGEQEKNAQILKNLGSAKILPQEKLTGQVLYQYIESLIQNIDEYKKNAEKGKKLVDLNAAEKIVDILEKIAF
ncbi:UDP-N-acetylglucosamine--N-acetylmuramyl-(pentapeptide) pyrophosphoryl-undecaprenol N-acetylglucosamine transferase [Candidatus Microgenomates bacterium]|nr:UDP-N-acetylglucosamine--N-acetylmuramyl-(pentapeptide) pyrophosphoryl-undecaprenol N-acetylglucosamine transferase [Candidatus Microgenomates bacterium]